ncbi:MAG: 3-oxoacyl-ACP reductase FabG [Oscillospiraceae bacterium]|jgi:3-oxoacyl-[acyl-carrier protein] reductase|nr:3-oxoacyl-ACP reductase FabG [Oscillospiraceae bacterium]
MPQTALVTGGAKGIGEQIVRGLCGDGLRVAFCYHTSEKQALRLSAELNSRGHQTLAIACDISSSHAVFEMFAQASDTFGPVSVLVNNAGIAQQKLFTDITDEDWQAMLGANLSGTFFCCRQAVPEMVKQKSGRIINIASVWGQAGASCEVHYSAAKAGVIGLTKALAKELAPSGITVNCVAPGAIATDMLSPFSQADLALLKEEIPMGRIGLAGEVASAVRFLASDAASYLTGQVIGVNGGLVC